MSADTLVFDMASASEGSALPFVRKDWVSILDSQNRNYQGNQCTIDTSQLANSNKYMNYREAYLIMPLMITLTGTGITSADYAVGMRTWFGSIIHSFSVEYNGTTIVQQTPFIGMINCFKLMTSLSYQDVLTQGPSIGFYPDTATSWGFASAAGNGGVSTCNNDITQAFSPVTLTSVGDHGNVGLLKRIQSWNFDDAASQGSSSFSNPVANSVLISTAQLTNLWKSYIFTNTATVVQYAITAQIYLKHLHSFFERIPLIKGVFMKLIFNLNQTSVSFTTTGALTAAQTITCTSVNSPLGGVSPLMITANNLAATGTAVGTGASSGLTAGNYICSIAVGATCLNTTQTGVAGVAQSPLNGSVQLAVPAYTFAPPFESSYLSSPIKKIVYEDIYQYTIAGVPANNQFTYLITNGIANVKSVLVLPYYAASSNLVGATFNCPPFQSPFDPAGAGPTSPLCLFTNFNVQISGQNAIYNVQRYVAEEFMNQLYGQKSVNGGMTDGLCSGLVDKVAFESCYCYYYVDVSRMLEQEEAVPKAINLIGQVQSLKPLDLYVFISYGVAISIDILSGARV